MISATDEYGTATEIKALASKTTKQEIYFPSRSTECKLQARSYRLTTHRH